MTTRFPAQLPYDDSLPLISVGDLVNQGRIVEAVNMMAANQKACANTLGAVNFWRAQYVPASAVVITPPCVPRALPRTQEYAADTVYAVQAAADSTVASWSVSSGGAPCYAAVRDDPNGPNVSETYGAGATSPLVIKAGQWLVQWLAPGTPGQSGRFSM